MWTGEDDRTFGEIIKLRDGGDLSAALALAHTLSQRHPEDSKLHWFVAHLYWKLGQLTDAVGSFSTATKLAPTMERASLGLFHCLWEQGKREEALIEAKRFLAVAESEDYQEIIREINEREGNRDTNP